jgi:hypothetical protein
MFRERRRQTSLLVIIGALWLDISACSSPTAPSVANVQGFWRGVWVADACTGTPYLNSDGVPSSFCDFAPNFGAFILRVTQSDRALRAYIGVSAHAINEVTGTVATDGTITLSGQGAGPFSNELMTLSSFKSTVSGKSMTGTFAFTVYVNGSTTDTFSIVGRLQDVSLFSPDPNAPAPF